MSLWVIVQEDQTRRHYDVLIAIEIKGKLQKVWLENFEMKPDMSYKIFFNLNGGEITYTGGVYR
ncbi:MAG: hypothetical protein IPJ16_05690 [Bacteroidales bacterium]|nr:hypothetical protein [Bacteroidales bacterium]